MKNFQSTTNEMKITSSPKERNTGFHSVTVTVGLLAWHHFHHCYLSPMDLARLPRGAILWLAETRSASQSPGPCWRAPQKGLPRFPPPCLARGTDPLWPASSNRCAAAGRAVSGTTPHRARHGAAALKRTEIHTWRRP